MTGKLQIFVLASVLMFGMTAAVCAESGQTLYVADYNSDGTLKSLRLMENYTYTTDDAVREYANLTPTQKAFVWDEDMKPVSRVIRYEADYGDNDFEDKWNF